MALNGDAHYFYRALFEHASEGVMVVDQGGIIRQMNPAAEHILHTHCNQVINQPLLDFCRTDSIYALWRQRLQYYLDDPLTIPAGHVVELLLINRFVNARITPVFNENRDYLGLLFVLPAENIISAPLMFKGYRELLLMDINGDLSDKQRDILNTIQDGITFLSEMIEDVFSISRFHIEHEAFIADDILVADVIQQVVAELLNIAEYDVKNFDVEVDVSSRTPILHSDKDKFQRIVKSIIQNAFDYTLAHGKIAITATTTAKQDRIIISVEDNGIGIPKEFQSRIWQRYQRDEHNAVFKMDMPGKGSGLSIARALVELLDGEMWFVSEYGIGTIFYVSLPVQPAAQTTPQPRIYG